MPGEANGVPAGSAPASIWSKWTARATRAFDGLQNVVSGLNTSRDKGFYSQYVPMKPLQQNELENMYRGAWLPRKIVDAITEDMTREWVTLSWDGYDDDEGGTEAIEVAESKLAVRAQMSDGVRWGLLHGGAGTIMRFKNDGLQLAEPLDVETIKKGDLVALNTFDRWYLIPEGSLMDEKPGPGFGLPLYYSLTGLPGGVSIPRIHASRIIRFNGAKTPRQAWLNNGFWDDSVLLAPMAAIKNYDQTTGGIASMVWEASVDIISSTGLADLLSQPDGPGKVTDRFLQAGIMKSFNRMLLLDKEGETYAQKTISFAGMKDVLDGMMNDVSGAADVPLTRLYGQSPRGLNATGESDTRNYYDLIKSKQAVNLRPPLERLYEILVRSELGRMPDDFDVDFTSLWQQSDKEKAETAKLWAETDAIYLDKGVATEGLIAREVKTRGTYGTMQEADVTLAEELAKQPDPVLPVPGAKPTNGKGQPPAATPPGGNQPPPAAAI